MAATALLKLGRITGRIDLEEQGFRTLQYLSGIIAEHPRAAAQGLIALDFHLGPTSEIVLVDGMAAGDTQTVLRTLRDRFLPSHVVVRKLAADNDAVPAVLEPLLTGRSAVDGQLTAYVCERGTCGLPIVGTDAILTEIERLAQRSGGV
jgi:uncharacterized protein YyaL (SSP411 family)